MAIEGVIRRIHAERIEVKDFERVNHIGVDGATSPDKFRTQ